MSRDQSNQPPEGISGYEDQEVAPQRSTGLIGFLIPVLLVAGLGVAGLFFYKERVTTKQAIGEKVLKARDKVKKHDLAALRDAEGLYQDALKLDGDFARAYASLALTYFHQSEHGLNTLQKARDWSQKADAEDVQSPDRYAVHAYLLIEEGNPEKAEAYVQDLLEQDLGASKLAHALGWAKAAQGKFLEGNRILRQAQEADFSAVAFRLTLAEFAQIEGDEKAAAKHLGGVTRQSLNPDHFLAKAWESALRLKSYGSLTKPAKFIDEVRTAAKEEGRLGPRAKGMLAWAEGELNLALLKPKEALAKADEAMKLLKDYPPLYDLKGRAYETQGEFDEAVKAYEAGLELEPTYRGVKWDLAELLSKRKDDAALALVDELEKSFQGTKGPEFTIFRAEHALRKGEVEEAEKLFTDAAELGDNPEILFGLAKVTFEEEKKRGNKADLEKVGNALGLALDAKRTYPEVHEYLGEISLWNYLVDGAHSEFETAEKQYKKLRRPIPEVVAFYDRVISQFDNLKAPRRVSRQARAKAQAWKQKKGQYLQSLITQ